MANQTVYPYGTNGNLPSSVGIINDLHTGGVDKALSAEQGVVIGEELYGSGRTRINLSALTEYGIYVAADTGKWATSTNTGFVFIPVNTGEKYQVFASENKGTAYSVTQDSSHTTGETPTYATGYSSLINVNANSASEQFTIPENGHYIVLWTKSANESIGLTVYKIEDEIVTPGLVERVDDLEDKTQGIGMLIVDFSSLTLYNLYIASETGIWTPWATTEVVFVPVSPGDVLQMKASSLGTTYALLQNNSHVAGTVAQYCDGYESGIAVNADETEEITIPNDGHYLAVWTKLSAGDTTPVLYSITVETIGRLLDGVSSLEDYKESLGLVPSGVNDNVIDYIKSIQVKSKVLTIREQELVPSVGSHITSFGGKLFFTKDAEKYDVEIHKSCEGLHISFLGDSITTFANYPGSSINYYTGSNAGVGSASDTWWGMLCDKLHCSVNRIYAKGGANVKDDLCLQYNKLFSDGTSGYSPEIIVILAGINDWNHNLTLGTLSDDESSNTTFYAAYKYLLKNLIDTYPNATIIPLTLLNSMYHGTSMPYVNGSNDTIRDYCKAIIECCGLYSVPSIDINKIVNINPSNYTEVLDDVTHPNKSGMTLIANAIFNNIYSLITR